MFGATCSDLGRGDSPAFRFRMQRRYFSLIELLVVIVILAVLGGIGAAVYSNSKGGRATIAGAGRMADAIAAARQVAVSENTRVALLLPLGAAFYASDYDKLLPTSSTGGDPGIAMRLCEVDENNVFIGWLPSHGWIPFPDRCYFNLDASVSTEVVAPLTPVGIGTCKAIVFERNGTLPSPGELKVYVRPYPEAGTSTLFEITVNWLTGLTETTKVGE